jgi:hypothetical protein
MILNTLFKNGSDRNLSNKSKKPTKGCYARNEAASITNPTVDAQIKA